MDTLAFVSKSCNLIHVWVRATAGLIEFVGVENHRYFNAFHVLSVVGSKGERLVLSLGWNGPRRAGSGAEF